MKSFAAASILVLGVLGRSWSQEPLSLPQALGHVMEVHRGSTSSVVLCVVNPGADHTSQKTLAKTIQYLHNHKDSGPIQWLAMEEPSSAFHVSRFTLSQDKHLMDMPQGEDSYFSDDYVLLTPDPDKLWNWEDPRRYEVYLQILHKVPTEEIPLKDPDFPKLIQKLKTSPGTALVICYSEHVQPLAQALGDKDFSYVLIGQPSLKLSRKTSHSGTR